MKGKLYYRSLSENIDHAELKKIKQQGYLAAAQRCLYLDKQCLVLPEFQGSSPNYQKRPSDKLKEQPRIGGDEKSIHQTHVCLIWDPSHITVKSEYLKHFDLYL